MVSACRLIRKGGNNSTGRGDPRREQHPKTTRRAPPSPGPAWRRQPGRMGRNRVCGSSPPSAWLPLPIPALGKNIHFFPRQGTGPSTEAQGIHLPSGVGTYELHPKSDAGPAGGVPAADAPAGGCDRSTPRDLIINPRPGF